MLPPIDFSVPSWLISYYHITGVISMILNSFGIYLLMFQNNKLDKIKYYMLAYQIACFSTDVHLTLLMQPIPLYPIFGGFTVGILSKYLDISTHFTMMAVIFFVLLQLEFLILCFERKHQALANTLKYHVMPAWFLYFCYGLCLCCPFVICAWFHHVHLEKKDQWEVIKESYPQFLPKFQTLDHFDVYINTPSFILLLILTISGGFVLFLFFLTYIVDIFRIMIQLKVKISAVRYKQHQEAIQGLMVQFAMSSFCIVPPFCLCILIILELNNAQLLTELCICWFAMHSSANMISLMIFFPPYRTYVTRQFRITVIFKEQIVNRPFDKPSNSIQPTVSPSRPREQSVLSFAKVS